MMASGRSRDQNGSENLIRYQKGRFAEGVSFSAVESVVFIRFLSVHGKIPVDDVYRKGRESTGVGMNLSSSSMRVKNRDRDERPEAAMSLEGASMGTPPMHNMIKVPVIAGLLFAVWMVLWFFIWPVYGLFGYSLLVMASMIVGLSLPLGSSLLVVILFW